MTEDGLLLILSLERLANREKDVVMTEKQSRITGVSDFCVNRKQTTDAYEFEVLISVQKKKALALVKIMPDSKIISTKEFFIDEAPVSIVCLGQSALIRCATQFKLGFMIKILKELYL